MPTKEQRQAEAKKHLGLMKAVFAKETAASAEAATIYEDGEGRELEDLYHAAGLPTPDEAPQAGPGAARANARMRDTAGVKSLKEES